MMLFTAWVPITLRPADLLEPMVEKARAQVKKSGAEPTDDRVLNQLLFPKLAAGLEKGGRRRPKAAAAEPEPEGATSPAPAEDASAPAATSPAPAEVVSEYPPAASTAAGSVCEFDVEVEGQIFRVRVSGAGGGAAAAPAGGEPAAPAAAAPAAGAITAPMQGLIVKIPVSVGDEVKLGDVVAVLEAMKMQNDITTSVAGKVQAVYVKEGEVVSPNQALVAVS